jgi:hypothetical protein
MLHFYHYIVPEFSEGQKIQLRFRQGSERISRGAFPWHSDKACSPWTVYFPEVGKNTWQGF